MQYIFDGLGYRRYEWKCHNENGPSKRAAERFRVLIRCIPPAYGGQGAENRDAAWFPFSATNGLP